MTLTRLLPAGLAALALALPATALAHPGQLDPTFAGGNVGTADVGPFADAAQSVARAPDGNLFVAGQAFADAGGTERDVAVLALDASGNLRSGFGSNGKAIIPVGAGVTGGASAIGVLPDGSLLVAALTTHGGGTPLMIATVSSAGTASAPVFAALPAGMTLATDVRVDGPNSVAYFAGRGGAANNDIAVARFTPAGAPDGGFGTGGLAHKTVGVGIPGGAISPLMTVAPDGKPILAAAGVEADNTTATISAVRFTIGGSPDGGFGSGGEARIPATPSMSQGAPRRVAASAAGAVVLFSQSVGGGGAAERFDPDGSVNTAFSGDGYTRVSNSNVAQPLDVVMADDGMMYFTGSDIVLTQTATTLARNMTFTTRVLPDGNRDPGWGEHGELGPVASYPQTDTVQGTPGASLLTPEGFVEVGSAVNLPTDTSTAPPSLFMFARLRTAADQAPNVTLAAAPAIQTVASPVAFTATATDPDVGGSVVRYEWDFDHDGTIDRVTTVPTTSFAYGTPGLYTAQVNAIDDEGVGALATTVVTINGLPPTADQLARAAAPVALKAVTLGMQVSKKARRGKRTVTLRFTKLAGAAGPLRAFVVIKRGKTVLVATSRSLRSSTKKLTYKLKVRKRQKLKATVTLVDRFGNVRTLRKTVKVR